VWQQEASALAILSHVILAAAADGAEELLVQGFRTDYYWISLQFSRGVLLRIAHFVNRVLAMK
jgi:hypothetical protein